MDGILKPAKLTLKLTKDDVNQILLLATQHRHSVGGENYDWTAVEYNYQNTIPENYTSLVRHYPEMATIKWGKEIEVSFPSDVSLVDMKLIIRADGYVCLQNWAGVTFSHANALPIAKMLTERGFPIINRMGDADAQRFV